jgi:beta-lactamase superfamily II metal-dependent hydrolase
MRTRDIATITGCTLALCLVLFLSRGGASAAPPMAQIKTLNYTLQAGSRCTTAQGGGGGWCWIQKFSVPNRPAAVMYAWDLGGGTWLYSSAGSGLTLYNNSNWAVYGVHLEVFWGKGKLILMRHASDQSTLTTHIQIMLLYQ